MASKRPALSVIAFANLCLLLVSMPPSSQEWLREEIGVGKRNMTNFMKVLRGRKLIYVADWARNGRLSNRVALWTWGFNQSDAPRPPPIPENIVKRNSKRRVRERKKHGS